MYQTVRHSCGDSVHVSVLSVIHVVTVSMYQTVSHSCGDSDHVSVLSVIHVMTVSMYLYCQSFK